MICIDKGLTLRMARYARQQRSKYQHGRDTMRMRHVFCIVAAVALLGGCSDPKDTKIPPIAQMDSIKGQMEKLTPEERELFAAYMMRTTIGDVFGRKEGTPTRDGVTIRQALEEQRKWLAEVKARENAEKALRAKMQAEKEAAEKAMRDAVNVTLVSKKLDIERGYSGMVMDEKIVVQFGYKNNTDKDIAGVKGRIVVQDLFGDELSAFQISNDSGIKAGGTNTWTGSRSVRFSMGSNKDRKLAELTDDKFKVKWEPQAIVFSDGSSMKTPEQ